MVNVALISTLYGRKINTAVLLVILLITVIAAFVSCAQTPLAVKYRTSNAVAIRLFVAAVVIYVAIMCSMAACVNSFMKAHEGEDEDKAMSLFVNMLTDALVNIKHVLYIVLPVLLIAAYVLGYMFTVKYLKRREN
jgi:hypothetical protein